MHTPTLLLVTALQFIMLAAAAVPLMRTAGAAALTRSALLSVVLATAAVALFSQRGVLPNIFTIVVANACLLVATQVWVGALYALCEVPRPTRKIEHAVVALCIVGLSVVWAADTSVGDIAFAKPRVVLAVIPMCFTSVWWMRALIRATPNQMSLSRRYLLVSTTIGLLLNLVRVVAFIVSPSGTDPIASSANGMVLIFANVSVLFAGLGAMLELEERSRNTLRSVNAQLAVDALTDPLTGLVNRRAMDRMADGIIRGARRQGWPVTVMLLDIDYFKRINDRWGHPAGDAVLKEIADVCTARLRGHDVLLRWGGEEFALILPQCSLEAADLVAQRFLADVRSTRLKAIQGEGVTLSIGVALLKPHEGDFDQAIARADNAMYEAKRSGRDRYVVYGAAEVGEPLKVQGE